jgi:nucleotide-binding universal stress UspA family protein
MYRSILVPLDGSVLAEHALPLALSIARRATAALEVAYVHAPMAVVYPENTPVLDDVFHCEIKTQQRAYLDDVVSRLKAVSSVPVQPVALEGPVAATLHKYASDKGISLVVMTTHSRGLAGRLWLGSVANRLIHEVPMPLLLVRPLEGKPAFAPEQALRHILVPLDGSGLAEQIIEPAVALGGLMDADYTLLRVVPALLSPSLRGTDEASVSHALFVQAQRIEADLHKDAQEYLERVAKRLRGRGLQVHTRVTIESQPASAILKVSTAPAIDLVALETHGRGAPARLVLGSVADKVVRGMALPVLVQRPAR